MKRRTFITGLSAAAITFFTGCSNLLGSDSPSTSSTPSTTHATSQTLSETTVEETTTDDNTTTKTTDTETTSGEPDGDRTTTNKKETSSSGDTTDSTITATIGEFVEIEDGLKLTVDNPRLLDSYQSGDETLQPGEGNVLGALTFTAKNTGKNARSLPDMTGPFIKVDDEEFGLVTLAEDKWQKFTGSDVSSGQPATVVGVFEVPKSAQTSQNLAVQVSYEAAEEKRIVRWHR